MGRPLVSVDESSLLTHWSYQSIHMTWSLRPPPIIILMEAKHILLDLLSVVRTLTHNLSKQALVPGAGCRAVSQVTCSISSASSMGEKVVLRQMGGPQIPALVKTVQVQAFFCCTFGIIVNDTQTRINQTIYTVGESNLIVLCYLYKYLVWYCYV